MEKTAVLIPCYNEELTVSKVVSDFRKSLPDATVYVYDNNSTDRTAQLAREAGAVVRRETRQGKGNVMRTMFREIDAQCYILVDGDDTYPAEAAPEMCRLVLEEGADMVVGDRLSGTYFFENKRPMHNTGNRLVRSLVNRLFKGDVVDIMSGYRAFSYNFIKTYPVLSNGFEVETEMTIHALDKNLKLANLPITYRDRPAGSVSKLNTVSDGTRVLKTIVKLFRDYRPLAFFGFVSLLLIAAALILIIPIIAEYVRTGLVPRFPTLFMAGFIGIGGLLSLICGFILDTIAARDRRDFEFKLQSADNQRKQNLK